MYWLPSPAANRACSACQDHCGRVQSGSLRTFRTPPRGSPGEGLMAMAGGRTSGLRRAALSIPIHLYIPEPQPWSVVCALRCGWSGLAKAIITVFEAPAGIRTHAVKATILKGQYFTTEPRDPNLNKNWMLYFNTAPEDRFPNLFHAAPKVL